MKYKDLKKLKMYNSLVSVIIPTYQRFDSLKVAINSVLKQTYKNIEIIVINDCSKDIRYETLNQLYSQESFPEKISHQEKSIYIKIINLPINMREKYKSKSCQGLTRNIGVENSKGEYLAFLDDDDCWVDPQKIEKQINAMKKFNILICGTNMYKGEGIYDSTENYKSYLSEQIKSQIGNLKDLIQTNILCNSTVIVNKDIYIYTGMQKIENYEDYECWKRIVTITGKFLYLNEKTAYYNFDPIGKTIYYEHGSRKKNTQVFNNSDITVVTGYFSIKSKFTENHYDFWLRNFLQLKCNMVIYTDKKNFQKIKEIRNDPNNTCIYIREIEDFFVSKDKDYWKYCKTIDRETNHTEELYMVWAEKTFLCQDALSRNPFNSEYFLWSDIGCVRNIDNIKYITSFPSIEKILLLPVEKFWLSLVYDFTENDFIIDGKIAKSLQNLNGLSCLPLARIQGGFFGGHKNTWQKWIDIFKNEIELFKETKTYGGKDQNLMNNIYIRQVHLNKESNFIHLEKFGKQGGDEWFSYLFKLS